MSKKGIEQHLTKALLQDGEMSYAFYKFDLEEYVDEWYESLQKDKNDFVFAVNENAGDVAMVLVTAEKTLYVNEKAREKLQTVWPESYESNLKLLIPIMADELANDTIPVNGIKSVST